MLREELKTDIGKRMFDFSPISKNHIPSEILKELIQIYLKEIELDLEYEIESIHVGSQVPPISRIITFFTEPDILLYTKWRGVFSVHGYEAPIVDFIPKES